MRFSRLGARWLVALSLGFCAPLPLHAQMSELGVRLHSGLAMPFGDFGGFYDPGIAVRVDGAYPVRERLDAIVDLGLDYINSQSGTYVPDTHLWRFQLGVEGDVVGSRDALVRIRPYGSVGAVYFRTKDFQVDGSTPADRSDWSNEDRRNYPGYLERISKTYLSGTGGLRLGIDAGDGVEWWVSGEMDWMAVGESEVAILRTVPLGSELSPFGSATNFAIMLGLSIRRP